jgi:hypothetical protein
MMKMEHYKPQKHLVRSRIDIGLLNDLAAIGEIRMSTDGRVLGLENLLRRSLLRKYRR